MYHPQSLCITTAIPHRFHQTGFLSLVHMNQLTSLPAGVFSYLPNLQQMYDCDFFLLLKWAAVAVDLRVFSWFLFDLVERSTIKFPMWRTAFFPTTICSLECRLVVFFFIALTGGLCAVSLTDLWLTATCHLYPQPRCREPFDAHSKIVLCRRQRRLVFCLVRPLLLY